MTIINLPSIYIDSPLIPLYERQERGRVVLSPDKGVSPEVSAVVAYCVHFANKLVIVSHINHNVVNPADCDVLCGRGNHLRSHQGNNWFKEQFTRERSKSYHHAAREQDRRVMVDYIKALAANTKCRFLQLKKLDNPGILLYKWVHLTDAKTSIKISQKYRDCYVLIPPLALSRSAVKVQRRRSIPGYTLNGQHAPINSTRQADTPQPFERRSSYQKDKLSSFSVGYSFQESTEPQLLSNNENFHLSHCSQPAVHCFFPNAKNEQSEAVAARQNFQSTTSVPEQSTRFFEASDDRCTYTFPDASMQGVDEWISTPRSEFAGLWHNLSNERHASSPTAALKSKAPTTELKHDIKRGHFSSTSWQFHHPISRDDINFQSTISFANQKLPAALSPVVANPPSAVDDSQNDKILCDMKASVARRPTAVADARQQQHALIEAQTTTTHWHPEKRQHHKQHSPTCFCSKLDTTKPHKFQDFGEFLFDDHTATNYH